MPMKSSKAIQYPAQTGPYKVFVKDKGLWHSHDTARLQISVGNPKHEAEKFFALTEWAAARFNKVILIVSDTLQRHNISYYKNIDADQAYALSLKMGDYWLAKNKKSIDILPNKIVTRWDDWITNPSYESIRNLLQAEYDKGAHLREAIDQKAIEFSSRQAGHNSPAITSVSVQYILEELAAFALMFDHNRAIDIYPGSWFKDIFDVIERSDTALADSFSQAECLRVDFVRNKPPVHTFLQKAA